MFFVLRYIHIIPCWSAMSSGFSIFRKSLWRKGLRQSGHPAVAVTPYTVWGYVYYGHLSNHDFTPLDLEPHCSYITINCDIDTI